MSKVKKILLFSVIIVSSSFLFSAPSNVPIVDDPYEWLEEMHSEDTKEWVIGQNKKTNQYFDDHSALEEIKERLYEIADLDSIGLPQKRGGRLFYFMRKKGEDQHTLVVQEPDGEVNTLVDPNLISVEGIIALKGFQISKNGKYLTFGLSESGSDKEKWYFLNLQSGEKCVDILDEMKFSTPVWSHDDKGVYYARFVDSSNTLQSIYYHLLGTEQKDDRLVYQNANLKGYLFNRLAVVFEGCYLMLSMEKGCDEKNGVYLLDLKSQESEEIFPYGVAKYEYIDECDEKLYFVTSHGVSRNKVIAVNAFSKEKIEEIIPEGKHLLNHAVMTDNSLVCSYFDDCKSVVKIFDTKGSFKHDVSLPCLGTVHVKGSETESFFLSFTNFVSPTTIYQHDIEEECTDVFFKPKISWDVDEYITTQVFFPSKDGTKIPMFITHKKGIMLNGETPTLMYGYGGFNIPITPFFSPLNLSWLESGGIYASVCLRGGGEYGPEWHNAGRLHKKQNVFDDFIASGEWLIANEYTSSKHLAITGGSNGGLLTGACLVQRPDLFAAVIPQVGVFDMLKFHKFTIGWAWISDYGNPDNFEDYENLLRYSPYHNITCGACYPSTLITTADHDDRVVPLHSFKFTARLQKYQGGKKPILLRVHSDAGHGAGRSISHKVKEYSEILHFLHNEL